MTTGATESQVVVPLSVRLLFGHAAIQNLADQLGVDILHIKGVAADPALRPGGYTGTDVDVLVRPEHIEIIDRGMRQSGWRLYSTFAYGSPFGHAQTYVHDVWGYIDIHRFFPGIRLDPNRAFEELWDERGRIELAGVECGVPSVRAQAMLLILNTARSTSRNKPDLVAIWSDASERRRAEIVRTVHDFQADVAFAAATGSLEDHRGKRDYLLWKVVSQGGPRSTEWLARVVAAPNLRAAIGIVARAPLVNVDHFTHELGRPPTSPELVREFFRRHARALREWWVFWTRRRR